MHLTPHSELFSEDFHAYSVGVNGQKTEMFVDKESFYRGYDEGTTETYECLLRRIVISKTSKISSKQQEQ